MLDRLAAQVGARYVLTRPSDIEPFVTGIRFGAGNALAVVQPGSLVELWRVLQVCSHAKLIVIPQAANTGLTGGSTPDGDDYDRPVVVISMRRLATVRLLQGGRQVLCLPGATLHQLERMLKPLGRAPHSEIGSSCIGASVIGGVCNNSGGALLRRGPAYTELAMYARIDARGQLQLVNHLGIELPPDEEEAIQLVETGRFDDDLVSWRGAASDPDYAQHVRDVEAETPARFNADPRRLHEASGSAGKLVVIAVRLDTFALDTGAAVFHLATDQESVLTDVRRHVLQHFRHLPIAAEYIHRDAMQMASDHGRDMFWLIRTLGTQRLPLLFSLKSRLDRLARRWCGPGISDRLLQAASRFLPPNLPARPRALAQRYEHHLLLKVPHDGLEEARAFLRARFHAARTGEYLECDAAEGERLFLHRFVAAGAANRFRAVHPETVEDIVAFDVALRRNDQAWHLPLDADLAPRVQHALRYGHFFCHVFHLDYIVKKGEDTERIKRRLAEMFDRKGAEYPAEHNVGHQYRAKPALARFYRELDPCNCFNPGIGKLPKYFRYADEANTNPATPIGRQA
nr:D-lactate dehydrogenase [Piscinibacter sp. HJYY11]